MRIVFHGDSSDAFSDGFTGLLSRPAEISTLPDWLTGEADRRIYAAADVLVSFKFNRKLPRPEGLKLLQIPGAGYDGIDFSALPEAAVVCNCFGHEQAIAEYVLAALLMHHVPFSDADRRLRTGDWWYKAGPIAGVHDEIADKTI